MKLNELKKPKGHTFNSKRIGRGIGSGKARHQEVDIKVRKLDQE